MNDTVTCATSRQSMSRKLQALKRAADELSMKVHPTKSKFICIGGDNSSDFELDGGIVIKHTNSHWRSQEGATGAVLPPIRLYFMF